MTPETTARRLRDFISKSNSRFGGKFDYSKVEYKTSYDDVIITCPKHGDFRQKPSTHIAAKFGCQACGIEHQLNDVYANEARLETKRKNFSDKFEAKSRLCHGSWYDYSKVVYKNSTSLVTVICPEHGEFEVTPNLHHNGDGCKSCTSKKRSSWRLFTQEGFLRKSKELHGDKYDYSKSVYVDSSTELIIICPEHGEFKQQAFAHMTTGNGCSKCGLEKGGRKNNQRVRDSIIDRFVEVHGHKYDYSKSVYVNSDSTTTVVCEMHGEFQILVSGHLSGRGCQKCANSGPSNPENEMFDFISSYAYTSIQSDRKILSGKELDVYSPDQKIAIEFNGVYWHSSNKQSDDASTSSQHVVKTNCCEDQGIQLFHIFENEWNEKKDIWKSVLKNAYGVSERRIHARKCEVVEIDSKTSMQFCKDNHLQGGAGSSVRYGLTFEGELVSLMTFGKARYSNVVEWELIRFCNALDTVVVGGASRLLKNFRKHNSGSIVSYANRRWSTGGLYRALGFTHSSTSQPCYYYLDGSCSKMYHRSTFMKHKLGKMLPNFDPILSEVENMYANGYRRIWDSGNYTFILK